MEPTIIACPGCSQKIRFKGEKGIVTCPHCGTKFGWNTMLTYEMEFKCSIHKKPFTAIFTRPNDRVLFTLSKMTADPDFIRKKLTPELLVQKEEKKYDARIFNFTGWHCVHCGVPFSRPHPFIHCSVCGDLVCGGTVGPIEGITFFTCVCGNQGPVEGTIESYNGNSTKVNHMATSKGQLGNSEQGKLSGNSGWKKLNG